MYVEVNKCCVVLVLEAAVIVRGDSITQGYIKTYTSCTIVVYKVVQECESVSAGFDCDSLIRTVVRV